MKIYLDVCCFNRPFDDPDQDRVRIEAEAVKAIVLRIGRGQWTGVKSSIVDFEIEQMPDPDRLIEVGLMAGDMQETVVPTEAERARALALGKLGFRAVDAMHLACAEKARVDVFLTTDDTLLTRKLHEPSCNFRPKGRNAPLSCGAAGLTPPLRFAAGACPLQASASQMDIARIRRLRAISRLRMAGRHSKILKVKVENPLRWFEQMVDK